MVTPAWAATQIDSFGLNLNGANGWEAVGSPHKNKAGLLRPDILAASGTIHILSTPFTDLRITKTNGVTTATPGGGVTYTITASNSGPNDITGATVADTFPASLTGVSWTCVGAGGGTCTAALVGMSPAGNGAPHTATYRISAPGGTWDIGDNGTYSVALQANQVRDTAGNFAAGGTLGIFNVNIGTTRYTVFLPLVARP